jgi:hypothetical protein
MRVQHEYDRGGPWHNWPTGTSTVDECRPLRENTGIATFARLVDHVLSIEPYASADTLPAAA